MKRFAVALAASLWLVSIGHAANVDVQRLTQETQRFGKNQAGEFDLVWWIPTEFWDAALSGDPAISPETRSEIQGAVGDYLIFAVLEGKVGPLGLRGSSKEDLSQKTKVRLKRAVLQPLQEAEVSPRVRTLLQVMKPYMANMLGQMGEGMHFLVYPGADASGTRYADPTQSGLLVVAVGDKTFNWRLPLGSLLPARFDPETGEEFPGNYTFSPFTGNRLGPARAMR